MGCLSLSGCGDQGTQPQAERQTVEKAKVSEPQQERPLHDTVQDKSNPTEALALVEPLPQSDSASGGATVAGQPATVLQPKPQSGLKADISQGEGKPGGGNATSPSSPSLPPPNGAALSPAVTASEAISQSLSRPRKLEDPKERAALVAEIKALEEQEKTELEAKARRLGLPISGTRPNGRPFVLRGFEGDTPLYESPDNINAAISTAADQVRGVVPFSVEGASIVAGIWESGGIPRLTHQEYAGRVVVKDGSSGATSHATHVTGTVAGTGINPLIKGMAPQVRVDAYNSTNDLSEMTAAGAAVSGEPNKIQLSNHSYGTRRGWYDDGVSWLGVFSDDGNPANDVDYGFGRYDASAAALDGMTYNLPYYLPFFSNGNMRSVGPPAAGATWYQGIGGTARIYNPAQHPAGNGVYKIQYDTMDGRKTAKNIMSIGAANDAVSNGQRQPSNGTLTSFSSSGPTDDGRIKPDLVANGASLTSAGSSSDTATQTSSGTSMSTPNAMGSTVLLLDYFQERFPGQTMRASTIKGLLIHTADDIGNPGPDYLYGWGLMNTLAAAQVIRDHADGGGNPVIVEDILTTAAPAKSSSFTWNGTDAIRVTLCWTDPAGTSTTNHDDRSPRLVNDLNLKVTGPGGTLHLPFVMPYVGDWSNAKLSAPATTGVNNVDNVEQVLITTPPQSGLYTVTVDHVGGLTNGSQRYSLIITGGGVPDPLAIMPNTGLISQGDEAGPFTPSAKDFVLENLGTEAITWSAVPDAPWLSVSQAGGILAGGANVTVTLSINENAAALPVGMHTAQLLFNDITHGINRTRPVSLRVMGYPQISVEQPEGTALENGLSVVQFGGLFPEVATHRRFVIKNSGDEVLQLGTCVVEGEHAADFTLGAFSSTQIPAGGAAYVTVSFTPSAEGERTASLSIPSNDPDANPFVVDLAGSGLVVEGGVKLVKEINATLGGINPLNALSMGSYILFSATTPNQGLELWRSDGTAGGTYLIKDINPEAASSSPGNLTRVGDRAFFSANDGSNGVELWVTDGTPSGTQMVRDIYSGISSSSPTNFAVVGSTLYFSALTATQGRELWKSDGTFSGTVLVADLVSGTTSSNPANLTAFQGEVVFSATVSASGTELYKSNGTSVGTVLVRDIESGSPSSSPSNFLVLGNDLFFTATTTVSGTELWKTNGTQAGTVMVRDILTGSSGSIPLGLIAFDGALYFRATTTAAGYELWRSDGTTEGTVMVKDMFPGSSNGLTTNMALFNDRLFFSATNGVDGFELWTSDGTASGTVMVGDFYAGASSASPINFRVVNGILYFSAFTAAGRELWKTNGTFAGTMQVRDINPGSASSSPVQLVEAGSLLIFACNDGAIGQELWRSDGTPAGTVPIGDFFPGSASSNPFQLANINGTLYFAANNGTEGIELWRSDATSAGTVLVRDINSGIASSSPSLITRVGGQLVFNANESTAGTELYVSNGTNAGTLRLRDIYVGTLSSSPAQYLNIGSQTFFSADDGLNGRELWRTDGTSGGTVMVKDIYAGTTASTPTAPINYKGILYFRATEAATGSELWRSDGTSAGTWRVKDIRPGTSSSSPFNFAVMNGLLYFSAFTTEEGYELWRTDGTDDGTVQVASMLPGSTSSNPSNLVAIGTTLYFTATSSLGTELWKSDGTAGGTQLVKDIQAGEASSNPGLLRASGGVLFFAADDGINGRELWRSDGTAVGTEMVADIAAGETGSNPESLINMAGVLYFTANDGVHGMELWKTDGSGAGTVMAADLHPGPAGSTPASLTAVGPHLYFSASSPFSGLELFRVERDVAARLVVSRPANTELVSGSSTVEMPRTAVSSTSFRTLTLTNAGSRPVTIQGVNITGPHADQFSFSGLSQNQLFGNDAATLDIHFTPNGNGLRTATLTISSDDPVRPSFSMGLAGSGGIEPEISLQHPVGTLLPDSGASLLFSETVLGSAAVVHEVLVSNGLSGSQLDIGSMAITGPHAGDFLLDRSAVPEMIQGGAGFMLNIAFQPLAAGVRTAQLTIVSSDPQRSPFVVALSGQGTPALGPGQTVFGGGSLTTRFAEDGAFDLAFGSSSGLPVVIEILGGGGAGTLNGSTFTPAPAGGSVSFKISQPGGDGYAAAEPIYRSMMIASGRFIKIARGPHANHAAGIKEDGTLWAWGANGSGQLGLGHTNPVAVPTQVGSDSDWAEAVLGGSFTLALKTNGSLWAWGGNSNGQLGLGDTVSRSSPVQVLPGTTWSRIAAGVSHSLAVQSNQTLWGWGLNTSYQLGLGNVTQRVSPVQIGSANTWTMAAAGGLHSVARQSNGTLWAWGSNTNGRLGTGDTTQRTIPTQIGSLTQWQTVACGAASTYALRSNGSLWVWGLNLDYQLGLGDTTDRTSPTQVGAALNWSDLMPGSSHGMALKSDGTLWGWGRTSSIGRIPLGTSSAVSNPAQVGTARDWSGGSGGVNHTLALKRDGTLFSAGLNDNGQLAAPLIETTQIASGGVLDSSVGSWRTHFIRADGSLWAVGSNIRDLGDGTTIPRRQPVRIGSANDWTKLEGGSNYIFGLRGEGTLWSCGLGQDGRLGDGTSTDQLSFVQVGTDTTWRQIAAGNGHGVGVKQDGTLWTWGYNILGQLGQNDTTSRSIPTQVGTGTDWAFVAGANTATYAIKTDGSLWAWGNNSNGRLGLGDTAGRLVPVRVGTENNWVSVRAGNIHTLALRSDSTLWAAGNNQYGQLGLGDSASRNVFVQVGNDTDWKEISAIHDHSLAIKTDGTLWGWGLNTSNQLGNGTGQNANQPVKIGNSNAWSRLATGTSSSYFSLAATEDGSLWGFGANTDAQLTEAVPLNSLLNSAHPAISPQSISVEPVVVSAFGVPLPLNGRSTSGLPVSYSVSGAGELNTAGTHVTISGPGAVKILAWQKGDYPAWAGSRLVQVDLIYKPVIITPPVSQVVSQFDPVTLTVTGESNAPMTYQWRHNGVPIPGAVGDAFHLDAALPLHAGNYDVVVSNIAGSVISAVATLKVASSTPIISTPPSHQILRPGDTLHLTASAFGTPPLRYQWKKDGRAIRGATSAALILEGVTSASAGQYAVAVTAAKTVTSAAAAVTIVPEAEQTLIATHGKSTTLRSLEAGPVISRVWTVNGAPLPANTRYSKSRDGRSLVIKDLRISDVGLYRCVVNAPGGSLTGGAIELVVTTSPPSLTWPMNLPDGVVSGAYSHQVLVSTNPFATPSYYKARGLPPGVVIDPATGLISGTPVRAGNYSVTVSAGNGNGATSATETLEIIPLPAGIEGLYTGLIGRHPAINGNLGGRLDLKVAKTGAYSGSLLMGRVKFPFKGSVLVDKTGVARPRVSVEVRRPGKPVPPPLNLDFELVIHQGVLADGARLSLEAEATSVEGWRQDWHRRDLPATSSAAYYTLALRLASEHLDQSDIPQGSGFASFTVSPAGTLKLSGRLADGTAVTQATFMGPNGQVGLFSALYDKKTSGSVLGRMEIGLGSDLVQARDNRLSGGLTWSKPALGGPTYGGGFDPVDLSIVGGAFPGTPLLLDVVPAIGNVRLRFSGGGLEESVTQPNLTFTIGLNNRVTIMPAENPGLATFKPQPSKGLFNGSFRLTDPHWEKPAPAMWPRQSTFQGIIVPTDGAHSGFGYFMLPALPIANPKTQPPDILSGEVLFEKTP